MQDKVEATRREIEELPRSRSGRRHYGAELRARVVALAEAWCRSGHALKGLAGELDIGAPLLSEWSRKARAMRAIRRVEVRPSDDAPRTALFAGPPRSPVIKLPSGAIIEGLSPTEIAALVYGVHGIHGARRAS